MKTTAKTKNQDNLTPMKTTNPTVMAFNVSELVENEIKRVTVNM